VPGKRTRCSALVLLHTYIPRWSGEPARGWAQRVVHAFCKGVNHSAHAHEPASVRCAERALGENTARVVEEPQSVRVAERARQAGQVDAEADDVDEEEDEEAAGAAGGGAAAAGARAAARKKTRADRNRQGRRRQAEVRPRARCAPPPARLPRWCPAARRVRPRCARQLAAPEALAQRAHLQRDGHKMGAPPPQAQYLFSRSFCVP